MGGCVGDSAMKWAEQATRVVELGRAVALQTAAAKQFVEAIEPAEAGRFHERNKRGVNGLARGRLPTQRFIAAAHAPNTHAARGEHIDAHGAVVELDDLNALGSTAAERTQPRLPFAASIPAAVVLGRFRGRRVALVSMRT